MVWFAILQDRVAAHQETPRSRDLRDPCTLPLRYRMIRSRDRCIILHMRMDAFDHDPA